MRDLMNIVLFGWYPYLVLTVFVVGSWLRFSGGQQAAWSGSEPLLRRQQMTWGVTLFHGGIMILFLGHFTGLLIPIRVFDAVGISHSFKQWMAIVIGGSAGVASFIGMTMLLHRRLFDAHIRATSPFGDIAILLLIEVQLVLGLATIVYALVEYIDGCAILNFMSWAQTILIMRPVVAAAQVADAPLIFKLHIVLGMTILLVLPFTRLLHFWRAPVRYLRRDVQVASSA